jgi:hypothetical protein
MHLYFAGYTAYAKEAKEAGLDHLLESYLTFRNKTGKGEFVAWHTEKGLINEHIFLDSGAFSAWTRKVKIDIDAYADFIKQNKQFLTVYGNLDVIGDAKGTERNQRYLESKGLHPIATFHIGSPYSELERMVKEYKYIALGGLVGVPRARRILHLDKCFRIIRDKVKIHGFGVGDFELMLRYPFYSVDNTNWILGGRIGVVYKFDKKTMKLQSTSASDKRILDRNKSPNLGNFLGKGNSHKNRTLENAIIFKEVESFVTRVWETRGIKWED